MNAVDMPANLKLVFEHLNAVRELDRYLRREGVDKDLERYVKEAFCPKLKERVPTLKTWHCDPGGSSAEWWPDSWKLKGDLYLTLYVILPGPLDLDDDNPSVNIYVPTPGHKVFSDRSTSCVKALMADGFELAADHDDWVKECAVGKYVPWLEPDRPFDENRLVERIALEVDKIVAIETQIADTIRETLAQSARTRPSRKSRTAKPHREK
jgi:hypothetical protein